MTQLSWQPPAVTKCRDCDKHSHYSSAYDEWYCNQDHRLAMNKALLLHKQNKNGITNTCPMWIEQNKETK